MNDCPICHKAVHVNEHVTVHEDCIREAWAQGFELGVESAADIYGSGTSARDMAILLYDSYINI